MREQRVLTTPEQDRDRPVRDLACARVDRQLVAPKETGARELTRTRGIPRACLRCAIDHDRDPAEQNGVADDTHIVAVDDNGQGHSSRDILRVHQDLASCCHAPGR
jgi:hypothetical protein